MHILLKRCASRLSCVQLTATPWTADHQNTLFMGFPRQEYWDGLPFSPPGDLSDPGIEPESPANLVHCRSIFITESLGKPHF